MVASKNPWSVMTLRISSSEVERAGELNSSQDGLVVMGGGISPCLTAGHGNCPKVLVIIEG